MVGVVHVLAIVLVLFLVPLPSHAEGTKGLSEEQKQVLANLKADREKFSVLRSPTGRLVILLGESHFQGKTPNDLQEASLKAFPYVGLEGMDVSRYWFGESAWAKIAEERKQRVAKGDVAFTPSHHIEKYVPKEKTRRLERGHVPDIYEHLYYTVEETHGLTYFLLPGVLAAGALAVPCVGLLNRLSREATSVSERQRYQRLSNRIAAAFGGSLAAMLAAAGGGFYAWYRAFDDEPEATHGFVGNRNVTMARDLAAWSQELTDREAPVLAVMGSAHLPGMVHHLTNRHGFELLSTSPPANQH